MKNLMTAEVEALRTFLVTTTGAVSANLRDGSTVTVADLDRELEARSKPMEDTVNITDDASRTAAVAGALDRFSVKSWQAVITADRERGPVEGLVTFSDGSRFGGVAK